MRFYKMEMSTFALWLNEFFAEFDQWMAVWIHNLYTVSGQFFTPFFSFISILGHDGIALILLSVILMFFRRTRRYGTAMLIALAIGALITNCCLKILIARARPYAEETKNFFGTDLYQQLWQAVGSKTESDKSFPSGHTTAAFAAMTAVFMTGKKKFSWLAFVFAILMAISRIYLVVHFASDVMVGVVIGLFSGYVGTLLARRIPDAFYQSNWPFRKKIEATNSN